MFKTKTIYECFIRLPQEVTVPVTFTFVRHDNPSTPLQRFSVSPGGSLWWKAQPGHEIIETPTSRVRLTSDPEPDKIFGTLVHMDVAYTFPDDPSPLHATEYWGQWREVTNPIPIGEYIKGTVTRTLLEYEGKRYRHENFGHQGAVAHFTNDIERLAKYMAEHNARSI